MVVESPAGRIAKADGRIVSARSQEDAPTGDTTAEEEEAPQSATVDVIRPPFARNNTNVMIVNEKNDLPPEVVEQLQTHHMMQEDDAITLGDIPSLADQSMRRTISSKPLLANLNHMQSLILKHFALLSLQKSGLGHLIELDEVLELMDMRKSQWWNKIFKGNAKDKQKKKGMSSLQDSMLCDVTKLMKRRLWRAARDFSREDRLGQSAGRVKFDFAGTRVYRGDDCYHEANG